MYAQPTTAFPPFEFHIIIIFLCLFAIHETIKTEQQESENALKSFLLFIVFFSSVLKTHQSLPSCARKLDYFAGEEK